MLRNVALRDNKRQHLFLWKGAIYRVKNGDSEERRKKPSCCRRLLLLSPIIIISMPPTQEKTQGSGGSREAGPKSTPFSCMPTIYYRIIYFRIKTVQNVGIYFQTFWIRKISCRKTLSTFTLCSSGE